MKLNFSKPLSDGFYKAHPVLTHVGIAILFLLGCTAFHYIHTIFFYGFISGFGQLLVFGIVSTLSVYPIFAVSRFPNNSPVLFFVLSWAAVVAVFYLQLQSAQEGEAIIRTPRGLVYDHGLLTPFGFLYSLLNPRTLMGLWATAELILSSTRRKDSPNFK
jgi:hypothetical protein